MRQLKANRIVGYDVMLAPRTPSPSHHRPQALSNNLYTCCDVQFTFATDPTLWRNLRYLSEKASSDAAENLRQPLYSLEEKRRRDATPWTVVQGVLAPLQFLVFLVSLGLVLHYLVTGEGLWIAICSIVIKTLLLYAIMITG
jgi:3-vinyl bacteriochlorophyllide hydratase